MMKWVTRGLGSIVTVTTVSRTLVDEKKEEKSGENFTTLF
jgi:hypothetical protein